MADIRLTALSESLAQTYGVMHFTGEGAFLNGTNGDLRLICGQCRHVIGENFSGLPNFLNAAARCSKCGTAVHLTRPCRYAKPVIMKRNLQPAVQPHEAFHCSSLHKGLACEKTITEVSDKILEEFVGTQGDRPRTLYHYTSGTGLAGIISTSSLWATDIAYMNDSSELQYAITLINEEIEHKVSGSNELVAELLRRANHPISPTNASSGYCAICFCTNGDLLSQWRAYGDAGKGFALGFDAYEFPGDIHRLRKVIYDPEIQRQLIRNTIKKFVEAFELASKGETKDSLDQKRILPAFSAAIASHLVECTFSFKHPAFVEEGEWRFIIEYNRDRHLPFIKFRSARELTIPYLAILFDVGPKENGLPAKPALPLLEVIQGPTLHEGLNLKASHLLLEQYGYEHVEVVASRTPLRF